MQEGCHGKNRGTGKREGSKTYATPKKERTTVLREPGASEKAGPGGQAGAGTGQKNYDRQKYQ